MPNNRQRGKYGERSARDAIREHWLMQDCQRTGQTSAAVSGADLSNTGRLHVEVKLRKTISAEKFLEQAERDKKTGNIPVVLMRRDKGEWIVMFRIKDSIQFASQVLSVCLATTKQERT
jgi:hypothetical protein